MGASSPLRALWGSVVGRPISSKAQPWFQLLVLLCVEGNPSPGNNRSGKVQYEGEFPACRNGDGEGVRTEQSGFGPPVGAKLAGPLVAEKPIIPCSRAFMDQYAAAPVVVRVGCGDKGGSGALCFLNCQGSWRNQRLPVRCCCCSQPGRWRVFPGQYRALSWDSGLRPVCGLRRPSACGLFRGYQLPGGSLRSGNQSAEQRLPC